VHRRCLLLAVVGNTDASSPSVSHILAGDYLSSVKKWLDEILEGAVGGVDLLLHLLTHIAKLPVTKSVVKSSGMGKIIGSLEKQPICKGSSNVVAINERIQLVKDNWNASVKARKSQDVPEIKPQAIEDSLNTDSKPLTKRPAEPESPSESSLAKRAKIADDSNKVATSFSSLLKKVASSNGKTPVDAAVPATDSGTTSAQPKKASKRVKWADHFGGALSVAQSLGGEETADGATAVAETSGSWSDRKKRDRLREKELLASAK
jgi:hypothetical protein